MLAKHMKKNCQISVNISGYIALLSKIFQQEWWWVWAGRFACPLPYELKKMDFLFFLNRFFSKKIYEIFFQICSMPLGYVELCARSKRKKSYFGGKCGFLRRMLGLKWDYCIYDLKQGLSLLYQWSKQFYIIFKPTDQLYENINQWKKVFGTMKEHYQRLQHPMTIKSFHHIIL